MTYTKSDCYTLEEFRDKCHFIYGEVMEYINTEETEWHFISSSYSPLHKRHHDTWVVLFYNAPNGYKYNESLCLNVNVNKIGEITIDCHHHLVST